MGLFAIVAGIGCAADLWSKHAIFRWHGYSPEHPRIWWIWEGYAGIETTLNIGAVGGILPGQLWLFTFLSVIALIAIVYWLWFKQATTDWTLTLTLAGVTAGILGNLYDRIVISAVRDWIRLSYNYDQFVWPNFNIADSLLVCGAALLVWKSFREPQAPPGAEEA